MATVVISSCSSCWVEGGYGWLCEVAGHKDARYPQCSRRRPSLPRPVRRGPPDRHQQRRLTLVTNLHRSVRRPTVRPAPGCDRIPAARRFVDAGDGPGLPRAVVGAWGKHDHGALGRDRRPSSGGRGWG
ncbi:hypothetical protein BKD26_37960 [Streptomyces sp. CB03238]|nr:hypothetical protein BKD26_37960 [Streptomyces sp. CB03238]